MDEPDVSDTAKAARQRLIDAQAEFLKKRQGAPPRTAVELDDSKPGEIRIIVRPDGRRLPADSETWHIELRQAVQSVVDRLSNSPSDLMPLNQHAGVEEILDSVFQWARAKFALDRSCQNMAEICCGYVPEPAEIFSAWQMAIQEAGTTLVDGGVCHDAAQAKEMLEAAESRFESNQKK